MARARARVLTRGPRRQLQWISPADAGFVTVASTTKVLIQSFNATVAGINRPTVVRTRGRVGVRPGAQAGADQAFVGAFGICVVSADAFAAGVASVPGPFSDADWSGWYVWESFNYTADFKSGVGYDLLSQEYDVDSKAMRKITANDTIVMVAESQSGAFDISMPLRTLMKLA